MRKKQVIDMLNSMRKACADRYSTCQEMKEDGVDNCKYYSEEHGCALGNLGKVPTAWEDEDIQRIAEGEE